ncbi:helicase-related protein [Pseudactinotalea suaedae]|uniref:helicase-related protein n=1 Tax=Pseudactinotalea suaedae TaxID=1524924 RepID=UPI0012E32B1D|nr:helicase-related protein [Pseudactinotalea suaedae]
MTVDGNLRDRAEPARRSTTFNAAPGSTVVIRDEEWLVTGADRTTDGWFVHVYGLTGITKDTTATFSTAIDTVVESDPRLTKVQADDSPGFRRSRIWLEAMLRKTPVPIDQRELTVAHRALADPLEYQLKAVRQALDPANLRPRILLADAVGLGKTLEIGMILAELVRRGRGDRILVVTPRHVLEQMQFELWTRFALPFVRLDSNGIQRIRQLLPATRNPFTYFKRVIISIDTLKSDTYINHLRRHRWDAVVIDESHNVTNSATLNNRLATLLSRQTDALILASATPHNGRAESFAELIRMLEPSAVTPQGDLIESEVKRLVIRRHRHSPDVASVVGSDWAERLPPDLRIVDPSPGEDAIAEELEHTWLWPTGSGPYSGSGSTLFAWTLAKAFLSSPAALLATVTDRQSRISANDTQAAARERAALDTLKDLAQQALEQPSAKYQELLKHLREIGVGNNGDTRAVVFAERIATLTWLQGNLQRDLGLADGQVKLMHGGLSDVEQQDTVEDFKLASSRARVLVTGDVASEGVNLHTQCHHLIHFDIPWSLIRIEQRNGRIDRYGQRKQPRLTTLLLSPSTERFGGDIRVLTRLVEREHEAHTALGDTASLMGTYDVKAEEDAIRDVIRGARSFEETVRTVDEVVDADGVDGFLARLLSLGMDDDDAVPHPSPSPQSVAGSGLFDGEVAFLDSALHQAFKTPGLPPENGVEWKTEPTHAIATLTPPPDLRQRLQVLPQSYLRDRQVTDRLRLATTVERGKTVLAQAVAAESTSAWPEAHYLAPLHPVLDWAADRALAELGRGHVFAVRGDVDAPTVLLQATLTNARGQVVAASYLHATFLSGNPTARPLVTPFASASDAVGALDLLDTNTGSVPRLDHLNEFISPAVDAAAVQVGDQIEAIGHETKRRVDAWIARSEQWTRAAEALIQREAIKQRTRDVSEETEIAQAMRPERTLLRPLLVVVPDEPGWTTGGAA